MVTLPEQPASALDLRLRAGLDPKGHFTQQKQITLLAPKETFSLGDALSGRFEAYDTLSRVFTLYATLNSTSELAEFRFILSWPKLKIEEKRSQYSKYACHELNFFLFKKDTEFFRTVVRPHLANKKDKTFLDRWLLEEDLAEFLHPWQFDRLNAVDQPTHAAGTAAITFTTGMRTITSIASIGTGICMACPSCTATTATPTDAIG
jgi:hypothetical protein